MNLLGDVMPLPPLASGWRPWPAPAKLNLFLRVVGRRNDGMHRLQTVFQLLDWGDQVDLRVRTDGRIERGAGAEGVAAEDDLAVRAARLLQVASATAAGADIVVHKRIPQGGGFGGGSSNAATVLMALNRMWGVSWGEERLTRLGLELGADVPVFVRGHSAWAEGVGEQLTPVSLPPRWYVLIHSGVHVATAELFQDAELTRNAPPLKMADFVLDWAGQNAFTPLVRSRSPRLAAVLDAVAALGQGGMTGTGGGCFLLADSEADARRKAAALAHLGRVQVAQGTQHSVLLDALSGWPGTEVSG